MTDDVEALTSGVRAGDRGSVARAITLVESSRPDHQEQAQRLLSVLMPFTGNSHRVGITGVPGAGKSTLIDSLGVRLIEAGHKVAVLAVDPSSSRTGGSILGDKTRMIRLSGDQAAFVRPSPSVGTLGGVAKATRESMLVMEAAGFGIVLIETVGVGQAEYVVADMVDTFVLLALARAGDELQGIKRGILEIADVVAVNKADGPEKSIAEQAARELAAALRLLRGSDQAHGGPPPVLACSALTSDGLGDLWTAISAHHARLGASGELAGRRRRQLVSWTRAMVRTRLLERLDDPAVRAVVDRSEAAVLAGALDPLQAVDAIVGTVGSLREG